MAFENSQEALEYWASLIVIRIESSFSSVDISEAHPEKLADRWDWKHGGKMKAQGEIKGIWKAHYKFEVPLAEKLGYLRYKVYFSGRERVVYLSVLFFEVSGGDCPDGDAPSEMIKSEGRVRLIIWWILILEFINLVSEVETTIRWQL